MAIPLEEAIDIQKKEKIKGSKFKCWNTIMIGKCKVCYAVHGICEREKVMMFRPIEKRFRCPICLYKNNLEICEKCCEKR